MWVGFFLVSRVIFGTKILSEKWKKMRRLGGMPKELYYIDDWRTPADRAWKVCRDFKSFREEVRRTWGRTATPRVCDLGVSFDFDLEDSGRDSGLDCARWLVKMNIIPERAWVHSANRHGGDRIISLLNKWYEVNGLTMTVPRIGWEIGGCSDEAIK